MPIRKLLERAGSLIQKIKPCFMMSPISIAQFLGPKSLRFDVIIFDEASQVRPEDALGAVLRGKQLAVMGDTRQLPPTTFFDSLIAGTAEQDEEKPGVRISDMESILHQCRRAFPTKTLRRHYRSRHESLIAVSNQELYRNDLLIYPSAVDASEDLGLRLIHLPDAVYDRGRSSRNLKEARAVAEAAIAHFRRFGAEKSLGIGTFNIRQQQAILDEIELQREPHPDLDDFFRADRHEHFFVKNLERIQGDERDVIFVSIGFGRDKNGSLSRNFGPLNQDGGERRINVLMTRAREQCTIFSNFRSADLAVDEQSARGVKVLKVFLEYAETRHLSATETAREDTDFPFEDAVADVLRGHGFEVRSRVGCGGFRIDVAVVDPTKPGQYVMAVECDGAKYYSSPVARDRDRLRQQILEGLGWRIHRIWSTDWCRNRRDTEARLIAAVKKAMSLPRSSTPRAAEKTADTSKPSSTPYVQCTSLSFVPAGKIHDQPASTLAAAVKEVVAVEGPIHLDELVHRIRDLWRKKRAGDRSRRAVENGVRLACDEGAVRRRGDFLWPLPERTVVVRNRQGRGPFKIEYVCDEELAEALAEVLRLQLATPLDDLVVRASRLIGVLATSDAVADRLRNVIQALIAASRLWRGPNGLINRAESA